MLIIIMHYTLHPVLYPINWQHEFTSKAENNVDHDQPASQKPADHGPHCFRNRFVYRALHGKGLICLLFLSIMQV